MESAENQEQSPQAKQQASESSNAKSLSKTETLKLLNDSIDRLEQTIKEISENSADDLPSSDSLNTLVTTTQQLAEDIAPSAPVTQESPLEETETETENSPTDETSSVEQQDPAEEQQPVVNKQKKKNFSLIALVVTAIAIVMGVIFWLWLPKQQTSLSSIPETPTAKISPSNDLNSDLEEIKIPSINPEANLPPTNNLETISDKSTEENNPLTNADADKDIVNSDLATSTETSIPQDLVAPGRAKNLKVVTIEPELTFTPEQSLIAALQVQVTQLAQEYATDFVDSIQVDLPQSRLSVEVNDDWYEIDEARQNKLANEMLKRSRKLKFSKLELKDSSGTLVARNPVVGDQIIILQNNLK